MLLLIVILQQPFQIRSLIEYLPCKLRVGDNPPIPIVLQGSGADIQPLAYFFTCEEMFSTIQRLVCLCYFLNSLAYTADSGQPTCTMFLSSSFIVSIMALFLSKKTPSPAAGNTLPMHGDHGKTRLPDSCHQSEGDGLHVLYTLLRGNEALKITRHLYI